MTTLQHIRKKITEEMVDLYEALFAEQEFLEENDHIAAGRRMANPMTARRAALGRCESNAS